ncbi:MAG: hypothetical protein V1707_00865, partial [bacterium]
TRLSRSPIIYALLGGVGIVLFWRGVWYTADQYFPWMTGPWSIIISIVLLLLIGIFVSQFIGNEILISSLKQEKKLSDKTEREVREDSITNKEIKDELAGITKKLETISRKLASKK